MAVAQGKTREEWLESFEELSWLDEVDQIGLSKISVPLSFGSSQQTDGCVSLARLECTKVLHSRFYDPNNFRPFPCKPVHLLGGDNYLPWELSQQKQYDWIFSNDSSATIWYGAHGETYDPCTGKIKNIITKKPDLENNNPTTVDLLNNSRENVLQNIAILHKFSK
jgi:hypothetical protein